MKKKKILFLYGPLHAGGAERVLLDLLHNIDDSRYILTLCLIIRQGILLPEVPKRIRVISLWDSYSVYYKIAYRMSIWFGNNYLFKRILKQKITDEYDFEISFLEGIPLKLHALMTSKAKKITWVHCDLYNFPYEAKQFYKNEELLAYNKMDSIIAVSNDAKTAFETRFPNCKTAVQVIYNPIDTKKIFKLSQEFKVTKNKIFTIVTLGRLTMPKKIDRSIRLAKRLQSENIPFLLQIIGDGELKNDLIQQAISLDVQNKIEFIGFQKNPFPYLKNADLMLLCSGFEGFGLVVCEAMVLGASVVSTKTAGPSEILDDNKYGILCNHDDESIYVAVKKMIYDEATRNHYQKVGYRRANDFSVENALATFEILINNM